MVSEILKKQKEFFASGKTLDLSFRINALKALKKAIVAREGEILGALKKDLSKSNFEGYMTEVGMVYSEIGFMLGRLPFLTRPHRVKTPMSQFPSKSYTVASPYGVALIVSPWNYPFQLTILPLVDCIAAGNCAIVKPSANAPETARVIRELIGEIFPDRYVAAVSGGREENASLLDEKYDLFFFTGGKETGKLIALKAASHLAPAVLELGGKSPCVVCADADIPLTAKRIAFGKFLNAGQTCVAPDYILADKRVRGALVEALKAEIVRMYGENPLINENYPKIVNRRQFDRILKLIDGKKTVFGGEYDETSLKITPTILDGADLSDAAMQEEIFGPVLPVIETDGYDSVKAAIEKNPDPLALYWFGKNRADARRAVREIRFGGGCINDTVIHLATHAMGFGGVGESGMGAYHGERGFYAFSHIKSIVDKSLKIDLPFRYQPCSAKKERTIRKFLK